jgi:hypothetical protein
MSTMARSASVAGLADAVIGRRRETTSPVATH